MAKTWKDAPLDIARNIAVTEGWAKGYNQAVREFGSHIAAVARTEARVLANAAELARCDGHEVTARSLTDLSKSWAEYEAIVRREIERHG